MNRGRIKYRQRAALFRHQQADFGTAENHPFRPLLRQELDDLKIVVA